MNSEAIKKVDGILQKPNRASRFDFSQVSVEIYCRTSSGLAFSSVKTIKTCSLRNLLSFGFVNDLLSIWHKGCMFKTLFFVHPVAMNLASLMVLGVI